MKIDGVEWDIFLVAKDRRSIDPEEGDGDGTRYITSYEYEIIAERRSTNGLRVVRRVPLGHATAYRFDGDGAFTDTLLGNNLISEADQVSQDLYEVAEMLFRDEDKSPVLNACGSCDVLYLSTITLDPAWRKLGIGFQVTATLIRAHGQTAHVVMRPAPLENITSREEGRRKLIRHWKGLGLDPYPANKELLWHEAGTVWPSLSEDAA